MKSPTSYLAVAFALFTFNFIHAQNPFDLKLDVFGLSHRSFNLDLEYGTQKNQSLVTNINLEFVERRDFRDEEYPFVGGTTYLNPLIGYRFYFGQHKNDIKGIGFGPTISADIEMYSSPGYKRFYEEVNGQPYNPDAIENMYIGLAGYYKWIFWDRLIVEPTIYPNFEFLNLIRGNSWTLDMNIHLHIGYRFGEIERQTS